MRKNPSKESMFWADQIARDVKDKVESDQKLKEITKKHGFFIYDEKTPSGEIHIGSARGWIMHDVVAKSMRELGLKARFVLSSDDMDPYDKPNKDLPTSYDKYLGMPFRNIPSPVKGFKSFADYYFCQATEKFEEFGIECDIESTAEQYINGTFNKFIKIALDNSDKISDVFESLYSKPYDRLPFNPICEKCGKIATTKATSWNKKTEILSYTCEKDLVKWAKGCGHSGKISPYNGNGKFPWKIEWAAKWPAKGVICEFAGKDHFTKLGSRDIAIRIADQVFDSHLPYPSKVETKGTHRIYTIGPGYEFFNIGGKKMSTSKGKGISFSKSTDILPAHMIKYLIVKARPTAVVDFDPFARNDIQLLYDRYDKTERIYFKIDKVSESEYNQARRIYELSHIGKIPKSCPLQISLTHAASVIQIGLSPEGGIDILKRTGHIPNSPTNQQLDSIKTRLHEASHWLTHIASEDHKFTLQKTPKVELKSKEKEALQNVLKLMDNKLSDQDLHNAIYDICRDVGIQTKDFFLASYKLLINKDRGPRLAPFLNAIGKDKLSNLLSQI